MSGRDDVTYKIIAKYGEYVTCREDLRQCGSSVEDENEDSLIHLRQQGDACLAVHPPVRASLLR